MDEDPVERLFAVAPEAFVAERAALAKALRADGDKAGADAVKALAKPTRAASAVNRLVREHGALVDALAAAAAGLAEAQDAALAGGGPGALRGATQDGRGAVEALVDAVGATESEATRGAVRATLHAALVDVEVLAAVRSGRLVREQAASGFGGSGVVVAGPVPTVRPPAGTKREQAEPSRSRDRPPTAKARAKAKRGPTAKRAKDDGHAAAERQARARAERAQAKAREAEARAAEEREREAQERRRQAALRTAKEAEAAAEAEVTAAEEDVERANAELTVRRRALKDAKRSLIEAHRERRRAERTES